MNGSGQTRGKGPFSSRNRSPASDAPRWAAPRVDLSEENIRALLQYVAKKNDRGMTRFFTNLARAEPEYRLAKNLSQLLRCMAEDDVEDIYQSGFSATENAYLGQLERWGVPVELLGVAHALLNVRERNYAARTLSDAFFSMKEKGVRLPPGVLDALLRKQRGES